MDDQRQRPIVVLDPGRTYSSFEKQSCPCGHWRADHPADRQCDGCDCPWFGRPDPAGKDDDWPAGIFPV